MSCCFRYSPTSGNEGRSDIQDTDIMCARDAFGQRHASSENASFQDHRPFKTENVCVCCKVVSWDGSLGDRAVHDESVCPAWPDRDVPLLQLHTLPPRVLLCHRRCETLSRAVTLRHHITALRAQVTANSTHARMHAGKDAVTVRYRGGYATCHEQGIGNTV